MLGRARKRSCGELGALPRAAWGQALSGLPRHQVGVSSVELSDVAFVDAMGVTALSVTVMPLPDKQAEVSLPPRHLLAVGTTSGRGLDRIEVAPR